MINNSKNIAVIFNYNLPDKTDTIYSKLISDGFDNKNIIVVDNGSDKQPLANSTNLSLPKNVRFTGQAYITLTYLLDFYKFSNLLLITTSARLKEDVNYFNTIKNVLKDVGDNFGFVSASLTGGDTQTNAQSQSQINMNVEYKVLYDYQPIMILISRKLISLCRDKKASYFNLDLKRGWGIDRELQYIANLNHLICYISRSFSVNWDTNLTHKMSLADETRKKYHAKANLEMNSVFSKKYGYDWEDSFKFAFDSKYRPCNKVKKVIKNILNLLGILESVHNLFKKITKKATTTN